jgi:hypothetical protein
MDKLISDRAAVKISEKVLEVLRYLQIDRLVLALFIYT